MPELTPEVAAELTPAAGDLIAALLLGSGTAQDWASLGWSQQLFLRKATGREPINRDEAEQVERLELHWLTLG